MVKDRWSGVSYAPKCKGACPKCGKKSLHHEGDSHYCTSCDNQVRRPESCKFRGYVDPDGNVTKNPKKRSARSNPAKRQTARSHKDVQFAVDVMGREQLFKTFEQAVAMAVNLAISDGRAHNVDALCSSRAGARFLMGDAGVDDYDEDPDASVFARVVIKAEHVGRVS